MQQQTRLLLRELSGEPPVVNACCVRVARMHVSWLCWERVASIYAPQLRTSFDQCFRRLFSLVHCFIIARLALWLHHAMDMLCFETGSSFSVVHGMKVRAWYQAAGLVHLHCILPHSPQVHSQNIPSSSSAPLSAIGSSLSQPLQCILRRACAEGQKACSSCLQLQGLTAAWGGAKSELP